MYEQKCNVCFYFDYFCNIVGLWRLLENNVIKFMIIPFGHKSNSKCERYLKHYLLTCQVMFLYPSAGVAFRRRIYMTSCHCYNWIVTSTFEVMRSYYEVTNSFAANEIARNLERVFFFIIYLFNQRRPVYISATHTGYAKKENNLLFYFVWSKLRSVSYGSKLSYNRRPFVVQLMVVLAYSCNTLL